MRSTIAILGAGAMGSAFATPASCHGYDVRLWGTHLDTAIVALLREGRVHPRTGEHVPGSISVFGHEQLADALAGADLVACAIASEGVQAVIGAAAPLLRAPRAILLMSKGFAFDPEGRVELLTDTVTRLLGAQGVTSPVVAVGGPCKANEVAAARPTATVYAAADLDLAVRLADELSTEDYRIEADDDPIGLEIAAALKNVFAIALGICDGLADRNSQPWHDLKAAVFAESVAEIARVIELVGGRPSTAVGLAGTGDLEVTGLSGRNRVYGELIGRGATPQDAFEQMRSQELTVEGHAAAGFSRQLVEERGGTSFWELVPLLELLTHSLEVGSFGKAVERALADAVLPGPKGARPGHLAAGPRGHREQPEDASPPGA